MKTPIDIANATSLFGRISLGYIVAESRRLPEWQRFAGRTTRQELMRDDGVASAVVERHFMRMAAPTQMHCRMHTQRGRVVVDVCTFVGVGDDQFRLQRLDQLDQPGDDGRNLQDGAAVDDIE